MFSLTAPFCNHRPWSRPTRRREAAYYPPNFVLGGVDAAHAPTSFVFLRFLLALLLLRSVLLRALLAIRTLGELGVGDSAVDGHEEVLRPRREDLLDIARVPVGNVGGRQVHTELAPAAGAKKRLAALGRGDLRERDVRMRLSRKQVPLSTPVERKHVPLDARRGHHPHPTAPVPAWRHESERPSESAATSYSTSSMRPGR